jgi:SAM-dependent methyltransferase
MQEDEFAGMIAADEHHWWFRGRRAVVGAVLDRLPVREPWTSLDAGCGSGRTLDMLADHGTVAGMDLNPLGVAHARRRGHEDVHESAIEELPFEDGRFTVITCLDVLEHTADDVVSLRELRRVLAPGGRIVLTVPAYPALWGQHDVTHEHYRRYTRGMLHRAAEQAGLSVQWDSFFNSILLPPAAAVRWTKRLLPESKTQGSELDATPKALNALFERPMHVEARIIAGGRRLPAGLSFLAVLR